MKAVAVYHVGTTAGQVQTYTLDTTVMGAFIPMNDRAHALLGGDYVEPHELYFDHTLDIRVGDKLVIDSVDYFVKYIFSAPFSGLAHKRAAISRASHA